MKSPMRLPRKWSSRDSLPANDARPSRLLLRSSLSGGPQVEPSTWARYAEVESLFFKRLDDPSLHLARFQSQFQRSGDGSKTTHQERSTLDEHHSRLASRMEKDLFTQKMRQGVAKSLFPLDCHKNVIIHTDNLQPIPASRPKQRRAGNSTGAAINENI